MKEFTENFDGVHLMSPLNSEYSLCGDAFDIHSSGDSDSGDLISTNKRTVTCEQCIKVIEACRGVRVKHG